MPGLGMSAWGKDKSESRITAEFYNCAIEVMRGAEAIDQYIALPQPEAFDIEYWLLEEAKLKRMPSEKELARQVIIVIGAGSGIGKETAHRLVKEGAHIVCVDLNVGARQTPRQKRSPTNTASGHRCRRNRSFQLLARPPVWPATSQIARASARCWIRSRSLTVGSIRFA